jgi:hypothetical protein
MRDRYRSRDVLAIVVAELHRVVLGSSSIVEGME